MIDLQKYRQIALKFKDATNLLWNRVSFITPAEIFAGEADLQAYEKEYDRLEQANRSAQNELTLESERLPEEEYTNLSRQISAVDDLFWNVDKKLWVIDDVITNLRKIEEAFEDREATKLFNDIRSINLEESCMRLSRLKLQ